MGVTGLWKLIEASGKPVPIELLENKTIAIDISIWLHQVVKGYQDNKGGHVHNAHIIGLFNRICKLLYYRIKPIFVFDGRACTLKYQTIQKRSQQKSKIHTEAERIEKLLLESLAKEHVLQEKLDASKSPSKKSKPVIDSKDDMFALPPVKDIKLDNILKREEEKDDDGDDEFSCTKKAYNHNITNIDVNSTYFKSLPADKRHEILVDIKDTRKQSSWGRIKELPVDSDEFSKQQMAGLLRRRQVQVSLEAAEKEMGGKTWSLTELESLLTEDGVIQTSMKHAQKIAADENVRFMLVRDVAKAISDAKKQEEDAQKSEPKPSTSKQAEIKEEQQQQLLDDDDEYDLELQKAIQLSLGQNIDEDVEEKIEVSETETIKLNDQQRRKFASTVKSHGLVRGFMMEYAEMNDDDIQDMIEKTQLETSANDDLNDSWSEKFPNTDRYVLYGSQTPTKEKKAAAAAASEENVKELVITVDAQMAKENDDLFADVFSEPPNNETQIEIEKEEVPDVEVASIASSDDDTIEYEIPEEIMQANEEITETESGFVSEEGKEMAIEEINVEEKNTTQCSENEKFWSILSDDDNEPVMKPSVVVNDDVTIENTAKNVIDARDDELAKPETVKEQPPPASIESTIPKQLSLEDQKEIESAVKALEYDLSREELENLQGDVKKQTKDFEHERNKLNRLGLSITQSMTRDCKDLLKLFGIPYIKSPMEAEAQCAFLNNIDMIDGIITDDSDVWLFGAKTVYKNFFVQKKNVMEFRIDSVQEMFHLDRKKLVQLAMLVGSDYTLGLSGVGAVTALEILAAFPETPQVQGETDQYQSVLSSLRKFRDWLKNGREAGPAGKTALKSKLKNVEIIEGFPSAEVMRAYLEPVIDTSTEPFSWGSPDYESLVEYTKTKLGWTRLKTDEILKPVLKRLNEKKQTTIKDYFKSQMAKKVFDNQKMSKRVQKAIGKIGGKEEEKEQEEKTEDKKTRKRKIAPKSKAAKKKQDTEDEKEKKAIEEFVLLLSDEDDDDDSNDMKPPEPKKSTPSPEKINAFSLLKQPAPPATKSPKKQPGAAFTRKRKAKNAGDPQPSTSKAATGANDDDDVLPPKRPPRIPETKQVIPQRERDKEEQEKKKKHAIDIFKKSKASKK